VLLLLQLVLLLHVNLVAQAHHWTQLRLGPTAAVTAAAAAVTAAAAVAAAVGAAAVGTSEDGLFAQFVCWGQEGCQLLQAGVVCYMLLVCCFRVLLVLHTWTCVVCCTCPCGAAFIVMLLGWQCFVIKRDWLSIWKSCLMI
jgi:hypothetical protein